MDIKDYLHLYIGCEVISTGGKHMGKLVGVSVNQATINPLDHFDPRVTPPQYLKPILRPLSDMTEEEAKHFFGLSDNAEVYCKVNHGNHTEFMYKWQDSEAIYDTRDGKSYSSIALTHDRHLLPTSSDGFLFLLSKYFDLFGLIDAGLALDATQTVNSDSEVQVSDTTEGDSSKSAD
jgi:hypothetical protein